jgi:hypothetical protein
MGTRQLLHLELPFTEHEVVTTAKPMPKEKAPRPDGFIGSFFRNCCDVIESASRPLVGFGVLNDNLIKSLMSFVKSMSRF